MTIQYSFHFTPYRYHFNQPLRTSHGIWRIREGIIITLGNSQSESTVEGKNGVGKGEIAPIPWFGSETLEDALSFCQKLGNRVTEADIHRIKDNLPACQFAFESALGEMEAGRDLGAGGKREDLLSYCYLLPGGSQVLDWELDKIIRSSENLIINTFKWKIGLEPLATEIAILQRLVERLPTETKLRLDANGGLTLAEAHQLLQFTDKIPQIEFIEQPLPPAKFCEMMALVATYQTSLALDESVSNIRQLQDCYNQGWRGVFVIKAAIAGKPSLLRQFCQQHSLDIVFSSVLETSIARQAALNLAQELGNKQRAVGFGTDYYFPQ